MKYLIFCNSDPGDLPHVVEHDLHYHRAPLQLGHLAQQILLLHPQLSVQTLCVHFLHESGESRNYLLCG